MRANPGQHAPKRSAAIPDGARDAAIWCDHAATWCASSGLHRRAREVAPQSRAAAPTPSCTFRLFSSFFRSSPMKTKSLVAAALALALSLPALSSMAAQPRLDLLGEPAPATAAQRTIAITPDTRYVNVQGGEVVRFDVGGHSFAWSFDGPVSLMSFDLARVAPSGMLDHPVTAYISPNPLYIGK
jgi:hypothetical protein